MKAALRTLGVLAALLLLATPSFAVLKPGDKLVPFSLKNVDGKDYTVALEDGRLTVTVAETVGGETKVVKTRPAAVLLDFWATYCVPCRKAMPHMQKLHESLKPAEGQASGGLHVIGIALDAAGGKVVRPFYQKLKITYPLLADPPAAAPAAGLAATSGDVKKRYGVQEIPVVYVVDASGTITHAHVGATEAQMAELDAAVKALVGGAGR
ncbi:MAG TPA: TlpA disulfide reductase family protein [Candidatus Aminicenantes bacterium]|nr:TlpA disulfide reductase family protein [Candidatus Aminicenantes bacterium]HRY65638.1 TlpA disulfide reductase family protein [Candidatus Aminicenantes bacterium]HRZ72474.1 TlpA disulfide reductase family protein [Candidatus Aminicenantes bacterium]